MATTKFHSEKAITVLSDIIAKIKRGEASLAAFDVFREHHRNDSAFAVVMRVVDTPLRARDPTGPVTYNVEGAREQVFSERSASVTVTEFRESGYVRGTVPVEAPKVMKPFGAREIDID